MSMSKKDYETAAQIIRNSRTQLVEDRMDESVWAIDRLALDFAEALEEENPFFDRQRFLRACGVIS